MYSPSSLVPVLIGCTSLSLAPVAEAQEPAATDIVDALEQELLHDPAVNSNDIDVDAENGVITLTGDVDDLRSKERARRIATTVRGVTSVVNRIEVDTPPWVTDATLIENVERALLADSATESFEIAVTVNDGHVVLDGQVDSMQERELGATVAKGVDGVRDLTNQIDVRYRDDRLPTEIEKEIEAALRWNVLTSGALIDVKVDEEGVAHLSGTVGSLAEVDRARREAWVAGVKRVETSKLEVEGWARDADLRARRPSPAPVEIATALDRALSVDPRVDEQAVTVHVRRYGNVVLRGLVDNLKAKRAAEQDAHNTVGVRSVANHVKVRPEQERANEAIETDVRAALLRDPVVSVNDVEVSVDDGEVELEGRVDTFYEKGQADDLAARVRGVTHVDNELVVDADPYVFDPFVDDWSIYSYPWYTPTVRLTFESDDEIHSQIRSELLWSPFVDSDEVTVEVDTGVATLTGTVDSWMERGAAQENAYEGGATFVRNDLEVESTAPN